MSTAPLAELLSNRLGWFVRDPHGNPVGFSSKDMVAAIEDAEGNGPFVRYNGRVIDEQYKAELHRRLTGRLRDNQ